MSFASMHNDYLDPDRYLGREGPCEVCGVGVDDCICPECPVCTVHGDPRCYPAHGLTRTIEQDHGAALVEEANRQQCAAEAQYADEWRAGI